MLTFQAQISPKSLHEWLHFPSLPICNRELVLASLWSLPSGRISEYKIKHKDTTPTDMRYTSFSHNPLQSTSGRSHTGRPTAVESHPTLLLLMFEPIEQPKHNLISDVGPFVLISAIFNMHYFDLVQAAHTWMPSVITRVWHLIHLTSQRSEAQLAGSYAAGPRAVVGLSALYQSNENSRRSK